MDFLVYSRGAPESVDAGDDPALNERHWSYMDGFAEQMTARGPTLGSDRETWSGSVHVLDLPGPDAAREFVDREPYKRAGRYAEHLVWRFTDLLGRTMWQFSGPADEPRFLVLAQDTDRTADPGVAGRPVSAADLPPLLRAGLVVYGELRTLDDQPAGVAIAVQVPSRAVLDTLVADRRTGLAGYRVVEVHDWEFGGRR